jgi:hypothetical protein
MTHPTRGPLLKDCLGPLSPANIDAQFCSDWLKDEIRRVFAERDAALARAEAAEKLLAEAAGLMTEWVGHPRASICALFSASRARAFLAKLPAPPGQTRAEGTDA